MIILLLIDISAVFLKSLMENRFGSMIKVELISVHFQVIIAISPPFSIPKREKAETNQSFKLCNSFWKYSVHMVPSLNPKHFDCLWVINHSGYFLFCLKRIIWTGFCTLSELQSDTSSLEAGLQPGSEPACLPSHRNHLEMPWTWEICADDSV